MRDRAVESGPAAKIHDDFLESILMPAPMRYVTERTDAYVIRRMRRPSRIRTMPPSDAVPPPECRTELRQTLMRIGSRWTRAMALALTSSALVASLLPSMANAASPSIVQGERSSVLIVEGDSLGQIARLDVGPGTWVAWATFSIRFQKPSGAANCSFRTAGAPTVDTHVLRSSKWIDGIEGYPFITDLEGITGATFRAGGSFRLFCRANVDDAIARRIRIVAMKVPGLDRVNLPAAGTPALDESTDAAIITRQRPVTLKADTWKTVAEVDLAPGRWWLHAAYVGVDNDPTVIDDYFDQVDCRLRFGGDVSRSDGEITFAGSRMDALDLAARATRATARATVECRSEEDTMTVRDLRISALRLGSLTRYDAAHEVQTSDGSGDPVAIHSRGVTRSVRSTSVQPFTAVVQVPVPAGSYLAKAVFGLVPTDAALDELNTESPETVCVLDGGVDQDSSSRRYATDNAWNLTTIVRRKTDGVVPLRCTWDMDASPVATIQNLRITLIKLGAIANDEL